MFLIGFSGANAMPNWILLSGMNSFSVTKADLNYSQERENTSAGHKNQYIIRNIGQTEIGWKSIIVWSAIKADGIIILIMSGSHEFYWIWGGFEERIVANLWDIQYLSTRRLHHTINPKLSLLFWTRPWSTCLVIDRLSHRI